MAEKSTAVVESPRGLVQLDATPSMPEGPSAVNVFARLHDAHAFLAVCRGQAVRVDDGLLKMSGGKGNRR